MVSLRAGGVLAEIGQRRRAVSPQFIVNIGQSATGPSFDRRLVRC
ncbi:hypothetical protein I545_3000 [Mycobacterium kansasii 662]|uniref:Uncharacterized protein n=2 Tax=Mycobacterium kansasii TaxID=1768 RepID=A0A1V3X019_MYCKA|nr:hypothetical protein I547_7568 [Mycobacterium kansasii 824]ETZ96798.1 hypothetical protein I547_7573 [Mycobacterium kansasii 824]EUA19038.1 hypothetical protein I545_3000 [Mycobacterium kansasii 662]OOK72126.1 hypothetical protein BZL30_5999 [Mycobacterium kansasii]